MEMSDLKEGDMLLYNGKGSTSRIINYFDNSYYAHASIFIGDGKVIESTLTGGGCKICDIETSAEKYDKVLIRRHEKFGLDMNPVLKRSHKLVDTKYDVIQILQLGLIGSTRRLRRFDFWGAKLLAVILEKANKIAMELAKNGDNRSVCSELAYRAYQDAIIGEEGEKDIYNIELPFKPTLLGGNKSHGMRIPEVLTNGSLISYFHGDKNIKSNNNFKFQVDSIVEKSDTGSSLDSLLDINFDDILISDFGDQVEDKKFTSNQFSFTQEEENEISYLLDKIETNRKRAPKAIPQEMFDDLGVKLEDFMILNNYNFTLPSNTDLDLSKSIASTMSSNKRDEFVRGFIEQRHHFVTAKDLRRASNFLDAGFYKNL